MKRLIGLLMLLFVFILGGCGDDEIIYVTNDDFLIKNNITDVVKVFERRSVEDDTQTVYFGNRKGKDWFALFNVKSGLLLEEWYGKERFYVNDGPEFSTSETFPVFKKLKNGEYVYKYNFEATDQIVYLLENQSVRYGFVLDESMSVYEVLEGKGFYGKKSDDTGSYSTVIYDFDGNICVTNVSVVGERPGFWYIGFQGEKVWIGINDENNNLKEIVGNEKFERNRKVHIGYGEYEEFFIKEIRKNNSIKTDWGYAFLPLYYTDGNTNGSFDVFLINNERLIFIPLTYSANNYDNSLRNWYNESILVGNRSVFSSEGKSIVELSGLSISDDDEPVSYKEVIRFRSWGNEFLRYDCIEDLGVWNTKIDKLENVQSNARKTMTVLEKKEQLWVYRCNIVNEDGSKSDFKFNLNVETGEVTYI